MSDGTDHSQSLPMLNLSVSEEDVIYLIIFGVLSAVIAMCWIVPIFHTIFKPFKLLVVALHESCHAGAALCTGGSVESIHVDSNEGGLTKTRGGAQCCILPAGYLGSNLAGGVLIFTARSFILSQVAAGLLCLALLGVLFKADSCLTRSVAAAFLGLVGAAWAVTLTTSLSPAPLAIVSLFLGILSVMYTIFDIYDDLIRRKVHESDASAFARKWPCCPARGYGCCWALVALAVGSGSIVGSVLYYDT